jgi:hydrogenase expression/formation protein HypC
MCLGIPMRILTRGERTAMVEFGGVTQEIGLDFLPEARVGDFVIVHAGFALERLDLIRAAHTLELIAGAAARSVDPTARGERRERWN